MIVWLASIFVTGGLGLAAWALKPARAPQMISLDGDVVASSRSVELQRSASERILEPALAFVSRITRKFTPTGVFDATARKLRVADLDRRWTPELVVGAQVAGFALGALFSFAYIGQVGATRNAIVMSLLLTGVLTMGPSARISRKGNERRKAIQNELPDVLDQLTVTVEAGMSFDGALLRAGQEGRGLLAKELLRAVHDMQLGLSRGEALHAMVERTDASDLRAFVSAVRQAEKHGFPLANILRLQAQELRDKRRARAEERAMQVPVKITFPLVFCILPALFIVILGPAVLQIAQGGLG